MKFIRSRFLSISHLCGRDSVAVELMKNCCCRDPVEFIFLNSPNKVSEFQRFRAGETVLFLNAHVMMLTQPLHRVKEIFHISICNWHFH